MPVALENHVFHPFQAPGNAHAVWIPLPSELSGHVPPVLALHPADRLRAEALQRAARLPVGTARCPYAAIAGERVSGESAVDRCRPAKCRAGKRSTRDLLYAAIP